MAGERRKKKSASRHGRSGAAVSKDALWQLPVIPQKIHNQVREGKFVDFDVYFPA